MPELRHNVLDLIHQRVHAEGHQTVGLHEIADGHALVDETGNGKRIMRRHDNRAALFLGQPFDGAGHLGTLAHHDTACAHLNGTQLGLVTVSQDHQVVFLDIALHQIRVGRCHQHLSLIHVSIFIAHDHVTVDGFDNIGVLGLRHAQDRALVHIHVGFGDIADGDEPFQLLPLGDGQRHHVILPHKLPCFFQGNIRIYPRSHPNLDILHLGTHIRHILRRFHAKIFQNKPAFLIELTGPLRHIAALMGQLVFQICVCDGRANRIRIRILVADNKNIPLLFCAHFPFSCQNSNIATP